MRTQKILVYGGSGLVGSEIVKILREDFILVAPTHAEVDLTNLRQIMQNIDTITPDQIIYAAGLTKIDEVEQQPELAYALNAEAPKIIAELVATRRIPLHYLSTNAVFDGLQTDRPYREDDRPSPVSVYGKSKLKGEKYVQEASMLNSVLRIIIPYSAAYRRKKDFARIIIESLRQKKQMEGIINQIINPIYTKTLVLAIREVLKKNANGIYNLGAVDWTTNDDFARKVAKTFGFSDDLIVPTTLEHFYKDKPGTRIPYCWLDTGKFRREFGEGVLKTLDEDLALFKEDYVSPHKSTSTRTRVATSRV